jgi:hypothetical protein
MFSLSTTASNGCIPLRHCDWVSQDFLSHDYSFFPSSPSTSVLNSKPSLKMGLTIVFQVMGNKKMTFLSYVSLSCWRSHVPQNLHTWLKAWMRGVFFSASILPRLSSYFVLEALGSPHLQWSQFWHCRLSPNLLCYHSISKCFSCPVISWFLVLFLSFSLQIILSFVTLTLPLQRQMEKACTVPCFPATPLFILMCVKLIF